jgi:MraZ protein
MIGHATDLELDSSGRILLPPSLREYAGLSRTAMLIGQGNRFELWDEGLWNANRDQWLKVDESAEELPPELATLSL